MTASALLGATLQAEIIRLLARPNDSDTPHKFGAFSNAAVRLLDPKAVHVANDSRWTSEVVTQEQITEALWILVSRGLVYVGLPFAHQAEGQRLELAHCMWQLTAAGAAAALGEDVNPDDGDGYTRHLRAAVPDADDLLLVYVGEALAAFQSKCYLASAVMIGVASEAAVSATADAFAAWLPTTEGTRLRGILASRTVFSKKFEEFRKRLEAHKPELPSELQEDLDVTLTAVASLLRGDRNASGHPTGKKISRERQQFNLTIFVPYAQRLYDLRTFFSNP